MFSKENLKNFGKDDGGGVTVELIALTAAIVVICASTMTVLQNGTKSTSDTINGGLTNMAVNTK